METVKIAKMRIIKSTPQLPNLNIVILDLVNGQPSIVRNASQFLIDCKESGLIGDDVTSIYHPQVNALKRHLIGGTVMGDIKYRKVGDKWTVTKDSRVITDATHPKHGTVSIGDELIADKARTIVDEGFLTVMRAPIYEQMDMNSQALAQATLAMQGAFDMLGISTSNSKAEEVVDIDDIPTEMISEIAKDTKAKAK